MSYDAGARVVVADDSLVIRMMLRNQLEEYGHVVIEAVDGVEALRACRESQPDVILLDIEMPKLDGHGVLGELRKSPQTAEIPVVFLTSRSTAEDVVEGLRLGAHDYLGKPFEPSELLARVSAAFRVKRLQDQLRRRNAELEAGSRIDDLTGLPNRRHLQEQLRASIRKDRTMVVLMVDVDHFEAVNDLLGHEMGDEVLREIAGRLASAGQADEVVGRWGGDEFLVIAPSTAAVGADALGEEFRAAVAATPIQIRNELVSITVSIGATAGTGDLATIRKAAAALYVAKATGRNRVEGS